MKRIQRGPVRGISLKLQEEERERRMDFVPDVSCLDKDRIEVDADTLKMLRSIDFPEVSGVVQEQVGRGYRGQRGRDNRFNKNSKPRGDKPRGERKPKPAQN